MTITIPHWLLYTAYGVAGVLIVLAVGIVLGFAWLGWMMAQAFKGGIWK